MLRGRLCARSTHGQGLPVVYGSRRAVATYPSGTLDAEAVWPLRRLAAGGARTTYSEVEIGMCGSHQRDQETIALLDDWGLDSVCRHSSRLMKPRWVAGQVPLARESRDLILSQDRIL
jgi:hypothetical protein